MKGVESCPDCWGTGFISGWGAPCGKSSNYESMTAYFDKFIPQGWFAPLTFSLDDVEGKLSCTEAFQSIVSRGCSPKEAIRLIIKYMRDAQKFGMITGFDLEEEFKKGGWPTDES